ncbi:hypothetical protein C0995_004521, partial [Termitomyces sp. Mi166
MTSSALFGITCSQTAYYFRMYPDDHRFLKGLVAMRLILEGGQAAFLVQATYYVYIMCKMPEKMSSALNVP